MTPDPSPDSVPSVLVGGMVAVLAGDVAGDGLLVVTADATDATCQVPPNAASPSPFV
jgi:hypothetical protein